MMKLRRLFIANRGEIALRVLRTCERLGIETVLGVSDADRHSVAARRADHVVRIGAAAPAASYLNIDAIAAAARAAGAQAVHPGYGFLSEKAAFAAACEAAGLVFIGPTPAQLEAVGDKLSARAHALAAAVPVVPGGSAASVQEAAALATKIGYPLLIKAVAGGGGRGMQRVDSRADLERAIDRSMAEAQAAFGDARIYLEHFVAAGRHIEVQVLGDGERSVHLGTRDCSIQRRFQKLIEEAPAPLLSTQLRADIESAALRLADQLRYRGLGTVEMLVDSASDRFYFLEMNARIQVEHPVTEAISGLDLVEEQIRVAEGRPLRWRQSDLHLEGHAIECRINAEDPTRDFRPSPGTVERARLPVGAGIRVDTHIEQGTEITPFYDSLLAKLIVSGTDRAATLDRLRGALAACDIRGVENTVSLHRAILATPEFAAGGVTTAFLPQWLERRNGAAAVLR
jgi:acetyl-CoA carboxylase biotin carboxylase subunit